MTNVIFGLAALCCAIAFALLLSAGLQGIAKGKDRQ